MNYNLRFLVVIINVLYACMLYAQPTAFSIIQPSCSSPTGTIIINAYDRMHYSIDGTTWSANNTFTGVPPGSYFLYISDSENNSNVEKSTKPIILFPIRCTRLTLLVTDSSLKPIDGATVYIAGQLYSTNYDGMLTLVLPEGDYPFHIDAWDFANKSGTVVLSGTNLQQSIILETQPVLRYWISLYFINENGQRLEGTSLFIINHMFTTNEDGYVLLHLPDGHYPFLAEAVGFHDYNGSITVDGNDNSYTFKMTETAVKLNIHKTINNRNPLPGSEVTFTITVQNLGNIPAVGVTVSDTLATGYRYSNSQISRGIDLIQNSGLWIVGDMDCGSSDTLTIRAVVNAEGDYHNTAYISALYCSSIASSTVMVIPISYPIAHDDYLSLPRMGSSLINVMANDTDFNGEMLMGAAIRITHQLPSGALAEARPDGTIFIDYSNVPALVGEEYLEYEITNIHGLTARARLYVNVTLSDIFIPDTFSPNGDGINDYFVIPGADQLTGNELIVYNRWGNIVFQMINYDNSWDGCRSTGEPLPSGTYFFTFNPGNKTTLKKGFIYLTR